jgi:Flavodoxin domain
MDNLINETMQHNIPGRRKYTVERREFFKFGIAAGAATLTTTSGSWALDYYPMPSGKKCAVIFGTWCGSSRDAAVWISEGMDGIADVFDVRENPDPSKYDHIILGGSIRSGATRQELQDYIKKNKGTLKNRVRALFAVCGNGEKPVGPEQKSSLIDNHLAKICETGTVPSSIPNLPASLLRITTFSSAPIVWHLAKRFWPE